MISCVVFPQTPIEPDVWRGMGRLTVPVALSWSREDDMVVTVAVGVVCKECVIERVM